MNGSPGSFGSINIFSITPSF
ncbi:hypothetical protein D018_4813A, partial [Vibrio parahaemolyticus VP2007-007]